MKRLEDAQKDGDIIYGLIKGVGINNDGGDKGSFMAPSAKGQAGAIINAFNDAQISPSSISYVEAHGTATPIGDPIEIEGLKIAFGKQEKNGFCALGSIKSNMGHTTAAAGVAGLIKIMLSMNHKQIPPMVGFNNPNPNIDFENSPFFINNKLIDWKADGPRRAGVSSFGIGSTNVHVILEEYNMEPLPSSEGRPLQLLTWSANSKNSLLGYQNALYSFVNNSKNISIADTAYTLNKTRENFNYRSFLVTSSIADTTEKLNPINGKNAKSSLVKIVPTEIGFLFPGQGAQYLQMGKELYVHEKVYRECVDRCAELLLNDLKLDIRQLIFPEHNTPEAEELLKNTRYTQPALFVTEYALSQLWMSWGIKPTFLCGHSIGEFTAAHLAGIMSLEHALHIVAERGRLISELPSGSMLAVRVPVEKITDLLPNSLSIAAINSNQFCVVSGTKEDIASFNLSLDALEIPNKILVTSHAFHSFMMEPILDAFKTELEKIKLNNPRLPVISTATGSWLTDSEATNPMYWVNHIKNTVLFADAMNTAFEMDDLILLEVGPGQTLCTLARQQASGKPISAFNSLSISKDDSEYATLLNALGEMYLHGIEPDWKSFYSQQKRQKVNLPSYVFDRKLCWIEPINTGFLNEIQKANAASYNLNSNPSNENVESEGLNNKADESKRDVILKKIADIIRNASGITYDTEAASNTFLELGLDSLSLTQLSGRLKKEFNLPITFRQLNKEYASPWLLSDYLELNLPDLDISIHSDKKNNKSVEISEVRNLENKINSTADSLILEQIVQQIQLLNTKIDALQKQQNGSVNDAASADSLIFKSTFSQEIVDGKTALINKQLSPHKKHSIIANESPVNGSKLGRDEYGNPAWFIEDPNQNGNYIKVKSIE